MNKLRVPSSVQLAISRFLYHRKVIMNNKQVIDNWLLKNNVDKSLPLDSLIDKNFLLKKEKVIEGQMSILIF